jgi:hypothetical protein
MHRCRRAIYCLSHLYRRQRSLLDHLFVCVDGWALNTCTATASQDNTVYGEDMLRRPFTAKIAAFDPCACTSKFDRTCLCSDRPRGGSSKPIPTRSKHHQILERPEIRSTWSSSRAFQCNFLFFQGFLSTELDVKLSNHI